MTRMHAFFNSLAAYIPTAVSISFSPTVQVFDEGQSTPGGGAQLIDQVTASGTPSSVTGTATGVWSAASGAWINWTTTAFANGRRVIGRTFLVPLGNTPVFQTDGSLNDTFRNAAVAAGNTLNGGTPQHVIYYNRGGASDPPKPTDKPHVFGFQTVSACNVPDKAGVLRSRRD